ncbi:Ornithine decarboxylase antizyme [Aphelenchoides fujianensis]|nr:Ornithine decarboxylase antizyme [Aphelenchoides fujianensis]
MSAMTSTNSTSSNFCVRRVALATFPEAKTLALFLPADVIPSKLSREHFVQLLEHCEEVLDFKRVLVCFNKKDIDPRQGIPRVLKCIGFSVLHPNSYPAWIDNKSVFSMVYNI